MNILVPVVVVSPLRERLIDEMEIRRFGRETQRNYIRDVGRFATFLGRPPDTTTAEEVRRFQVEQCELGVPVPTMNSIVSALRFFFTQTLDRPDLARKLVRTKHVRKLPVVLSPEEVARLLDATTCLKHQAALSVAYGAGLRAAAARIWLAEREADLLPVGYFHVVFTLPAEAGDIALQNKAAVYGLLFQAASETMTIIAADPKHLGARIGITAVLHTWGSALTHHPHIHMIVPGGGLSPDGSRWLSSRPAFLLPVRVLGKLFRRLFLTRLVALHETGRLAFYGSLAHLTDRRAFLRHLSPVRKKRWVVYANPPFA